LLATRERYESLEPTNDGQYKSTGSKGSKKRKQITFASSDEESSSSRKYCLIHGLCTHDPNSCTDLKEFASLKKKKKKAAAAAEKTKFCRTQRNNHWSKTGSSQYKKYIPHEEVNSLVEKKVKKHCLRN